MKFKTVKTKFLVLRNALHGNTSLSFSFLLTNEYLGDNGCRWLVQHASRGGYLKGRVPAHLEGGEAVVPGRWIRRSVRLIGAQHAAEARESVLPVRLEAYAIGLAAYSQIEIQAEMHENSAGGCLVA